jgi:exonuclease III
MIVSHLNVNSLRNKFSEISQIVNYCDILCLSETKLNASFPSSQFSVPNYRIIRNDRNAHG